MQQKKALVILSPGFAENEADSTCLPAQQQFINALNEQFPSVKLVILAFQYPFSNKNYQWNGAWVIPFNGKNKGKLYRFLLWIRVWNELNRLKKQYQLIGLFSFWFGECALIGKWFSKRNQFKHFTWVLGQDAGPGNKYVKWLRPLPDELVAMSDFLSKAFEKNYGIRPAYMIPNGIDPRIFSEQVPERDIDILGVGSLIPLKRYDLFIDIIKELKKQIPFIKAVLCGEGSERMRLALMIAEAGLQESVLLMGEQSHSAVLQVMQRSKVLLHPSSYEGFSGACLEALYAGAHVISFCNPKDAWVRHWHIVDDKDNMIQQALEILLTPDIEHKPVLAYTMNHTAKSIMELFDHIETAIS